MDVSWWWAFSMTFDQNHNRKCGKSLTLKALCLRNLFHQDWWWMENSTATFWGEWRKTSGANVQTSGATTHGPCIMTMLQLTHHSWCGSFWLLQRQSFFLFPKTKLKLKGQHFDRSEEIQTKSQDEMKMLMCNDSQQCFWLRKSSWDHCRNAKGDYFDGDGGK